jgi:CAAX protease family protein
MCSASQRSTRQRSTGPRKSGVAICQKTVRGSTGAPPVACSSIGPIWCCGQQLPNICHGQTCGICAKIASKQILKANWQFGAWPQQVGSAERRIAVSRVSTLVKRHPLTTFFILAYALSWWAWILYAFGLFPNPVASFGPFLAAIVVLALTEGKSGLLGLFRRMVRWRISPGWYVVALFLPAVLAAAAALLNVVLGAQRPSEAQLGGWPGIPGTFAIVLLIPGVGGAWEEPGWRGYALPRLQNGRSALTAGLILAALITGWHLPLMIAGQIHYSDVVLIIAAVIVFNWVFNNANGSVLIIMLMHAANNAVSGSFFSPMFTGADSVRQSWLLALVWVVVAVLVIAISGPTNLSRKYDKQEEALPDSEPVPNRQGV